VPLQPGIDPFGFQIERRPPMRTCRISFRSHVVLIVSRLTAACAAAVTVNQVFIVILRVGDALRVLGTHRDGGATRHEARDDV
jgi:hypothetical protein